MLGAVVRIIGWDPGVGAQVTLRAASHDDAAVCHMDGQVWWPAITKLPVLRYDLFDGAFGGAIVAPSSSMTLAIEPWPNFGRYSLADATFELWTGEVGAPFAQWTNRFNGRLTEQPEVADGVASIAFAVDDRWLDEPLLDLYEGTTGAEGDAALKGTPKPLAIGAPRYVPGVLVDGVDNILQLSAYGPIMGVDVALERLNRFAAPVADYPTFAALKAATIAPGAWATCNAQGFVRHGAPLEGQPSYLMRGDRAGSVGWARLPGAVIKRIAEMKGAGNRVSDASLAALDAAAPWPISLWLSEQVTVRDIIQRIAASVNAVAGVSWLGELFVVPVAIGTPTIDLRTDGTALPPTGDLTQIAIAQPFWRIGLQAERTWQVHALSDVAFGAELIERGPYNPVEVYREGAIVTLPDGSRWLYVAATPTAGNAPSEGSAYWSVLTRAVTVPGYFTVGARGNAAQVPGHYLHGLRSADGSPIAVTYDRSYTVCHYDVQTGDWSSRSFDVFGDGEIDYGYGTGAGSNAAAMAAYLNAIPNGNPVVVFTSDEPATNRLGMGLPTAMYRCGASAAVFGGNGDAFPYRCAYILVGFAGAGEGNAAFERAHPGGIDNSPNAWLMTSFSIVNGVLQLGARDGLDGRDGTDGIGAPGADGRTSYTHYAYANAPVAPFPDFTTDQAGTRAYEGSYSDFVEADSQDPTRYAWREYKGPPFGMTARGNAVIAGNQVVKSGGVLAWDSDAYSTVGFRGSAKVSFRFDPAYHAMAGLNTDPTADASYMSLDAAWYNEPGTPAVRIHENAVDRGTQGQPDSGAVFSVEYDGVCYTYSINGTPVRQVSTGPNLTHYFDSSFYSPGARLRDVSFTAGSQRPSGLTLIPHPDAPRTITSANSARHYGDFGGWGNGKAYSRESYVGGAVAEWTVPAGSAGANVMAGLTQNPSGSVSFDTITFAIIQDPAGGTAAFINGNGQASGPSVNPNVENRYRVAFDGLNTVRFYINNVQFWSFAWVGVNDPLWFAVALASANPAVTDVSLSKAGAQGKDGGAGAPGGPGRDGLTSYIHTAFANSDDGRIDFTTLLPEGRAFIGQYADNSPTDSVNPASYDWVAYKGPPGFGLAPQGFAYIASNAVILSADQSAWGGASGYSTEGWRGGAQTSFKLPTGGNFGGLNTNPTGSSDYASIDYSFHRSGTSTVAIYESGGYIGDWPADVNATFQIVYDNRTITYLINGAVVRGPFTVPPNQTFFFDSALTGVTGNRVTDITFSKVGPAGGDGAPGGPGAPGPAGNDGFVVSASPPAIVIPCYSSGAPKPSWNGGSFRIRLQKGGQEITAGVTYSFHSPSNIASPGMNGQDFNFAGISADRGEVTLRATYAGVNYDQRVAVTKTLDGEAAFKAYQPITQGGATIGATTVPGGRPATISANATYYVSSGGSGVGRAVLSLYWRNQTDNGGWNLLGQVQGSYAERANVGSEAEPWYQDTPGTASLSRSFTSPSPDKLIQYRADLDANGGSSPMNYGGQVKLEVG